MPIKGVFTPYDMERFRKAINYIHQHYREKCSAESLTEEIGIDIKLLRTGILFITGMTIHAYLSKIRLGKAIEDLADFNNSLKLIAKKNGYSSHSHFCWEFKRQTGKTPTEYRFQLMTDQVHAGL